MIGVTQEKDRVILLLPGRRRDVKLSCGQAYKFIEFLQERAAKAELEPATLATQIWELKVESYDGYVAIRFYPPWVGNADRVPLTAAVARKLADLVKFKAEQAAYRMRFEFI